MKAYFDATMFMTIIPIANDKKKTSNFLFNYSFYSIRERAIIAAKSIIEPKGKNKLTIEKVITNLQKYEEHKQFADKIYAEYKELLVSEGAKRVKEFRDALCHNIKCDYEKMIYCKDLMNIIGVIMKILENIYLHIFNVVNEDFYKIIPLSNMLADDYWAAICEQADKMPNRLNELKELQKMLDCNGTIMGQ